MPLFAVTTVCRRTVAVTQTAVFASFEVCKVDNMLSVVLYSSGCCKAQFLAQQHVDLSLEVPGGDARTQLRNAYSFVPALRR